MSDFHPWAALEEGVLRVRLVDSHPVRSLDLDCVIDLTDFGDVVGIEVLDLRRQLAGGTIDPPSRQGDVRWSYDKEIDALYVHVADGRGQVQRRSTARAQLDRVNHVVQLDVQFPQTD